MTKKFNIPNISIFFVLFNNGDTHYFTVKKTNEIFKIYWDNFNKVYGNEEGAMIPEAHSIDFTKNSFALKSSTGETICNLEDYNKKKSANNGQLSFAYLPEIAMLYIDPDLRAELLARGQLTYDDDARSIPGILYEAITEQPEINTNEFFNETTIDEDTQFEEEPFEQESQAYTRARRPQHGIQNIHRV